MKHGVGQRRARWSSYEAGRKYRQRKSSYLTQNYDAIRLTFFFRLGYRNKT